MDLTKITTPFGLLDSETQEALMAHGGPYEWFCMNGWIAWCPPILDDHRHLTIRVKPSPPKPREWWIVLNDNGIGTALPWEPNAPQGPVVRAIEVRD